MIRILRSFYHAVIGIWYCIKNETNFKIQLFFSVMVIAGGIFFTISLVEWLVVVLCIGWVLALEMVNTALENFCNLIQKNFHPQIKVIKDVTAGAVFLSAIGATVIGAIIFIPKVILFFQAF